MSTMTTDTSIDNKFATLVVSMAEDLRETVAGIEGGFPSTRNHYDKYLALLGQFPAGTYRHVVAAALVVAGANSAGVDAASKILG